jgi:hypothetical protein
MSFRITLKDERAFITELMNLKITGDHGSGLRRFIGQQRAYLPSLLGKLAGVVAAHPELVPVPRTVQEMSDPNFGRQKLDRMAMLVFDPKCRLSSDRIDLDHAFLSSRVQAYLSFLRERFRPIADLSDPTERRLALFAIAARYQYDGPQDLVHKFDRGNFTFPALVNLDYSGSEAARIDAEEKAKAGGAIHSQFCGCGPCRRARQEAAWKPPAVPAPPVPATDPFLRWIIAADTFVHLLKRCANSDCHTPYFVAGKETQLYCSESCAAPSVKKSKREWARKSRGG